VPLILVLFHNPSHDDAGLLNECLKKKNAFVDGKNKVFSIPFPDGYLIVCYDEPPGNLMIDEMREKINVSDHGVNSLKINELIY